MMAQDTFLKANMSGVEALVDVRQELTKQWAGDIARGTDGVIAKAILFATGQEWKLLDLSRLHSMRYAGSKWQTIHLDGEPILELHDVEFDSGNTEAGNYTITATQNYVFLGKARAANGLSRDTQEG